MMSTHSFEEPFIWLELLLSLKITLGDFLMWIKQIQIVSGKEMNDSVISVHLLAGV